MSVVTVQVVAEAANWLGGRRRFWLVSSTMRRAAAIGLKSTA